MANPTIIHAIINRDMKDCIQIRIPVLIQWFGYETILTSKNEILFGWSTVMMLLFY